MDENANANNSSDKNSQESLKAVNEPTTKKKNSKIWAIISIAAVVVIIGFLYFKFLPMHEYKESVSEYNNLVEEYNSLIDKREILMTDVQEKNAVLESNIEEAQKAVDSGQAPRDDSTLTALNDSIVNAKKSKYVLGPVIDKQELLKITDKDKKLYRKDLLSKSEDVSNMSEDLAVLENDLNAEIKELSAVDYGNVIDALATAKDDYEESVRDLAKISVVVPKGASQYRNLNYTDVEKELKDAGFKNITENPVADLKSQNNKQMNAVISVSINEELGFKAGTQFKASDPVIIEFHTYKQGKPSDKNKDKKEDTTLKIPFTSKEEEGKNYEYVKNQLNDAGITNIKTTGIDDLVTGIVTKKNTIESITVDGDSDFKKDQDVTNKTVRIFYHTNGGDVLSEEDQNIIDCKKHDDSSKIPVSVPFNSKDAEGVNYKKIILQLYDADFRNIYLEPKSSNVFKVWQIDGAVTSITISGQSTFNSGDDFTQSDVVRVYYYKK